MYFGLTRSHHKQYLYTTEFIINIALELRLCLTYIIMFWLVHIILLSLLKHNDS